MFMENRLAIDNGFTGGDFEGLILLLFIGFNLYISNFKPDLSTGWLKYIININMVILSLLIILGIKKGTIVSFLTGFIIIQICSFFFIEKTDTEAISQPKKNLRNLFYIILLPLILTLPFFLLNQALFGFGTDSSRETCFFLSAMQPDKSFQQPHIHNLYLEYFYNWGFVALLYFLPPLVILCKDIIDIAKKSTDKAVKLFSTISLSCIAFFLVFFTAESPSMITHITFFSLLGFLESVKMSFIKVKEDSKDDYKKIPKFFRKIKNFIYHK